MPYISRMDIEMTLDRWEAWWDCANETPLVTAWVPSDPPAPWHELGDRDRWMDFEARIEALDAAIAGEPAFGDNVPSWFPNLGPDIAAAPWGSQLAFARDTSWAHPIGETLAEVDLSSPDFQAPMWRAIEDFLDLCLERGEGKWLTGYTDLHLGADLLVSLIGPENLCLEFADDREAVAAALSTALPHCLAMLQSQQDRVLARQPVTFSWMAAPVRGRMHIPSCDFCCLISEADFQEVILPGIVQETKACDRSIFHLDGPRALRHLESLLAVDTIHGIQWVYGAGAGPALRWREVYERIQAAGRCMQVACETPEDALELNKTLGPEGVWYQIPGMSLPEAEDLREQLQNSSGPGR